MSYTIRIGKQKPGRPAGGKNYGLKAYKKAFNDNMRHTDENSMCSHIFISTVDIETIERNLDELYNEETMKEIIMDTEGIKGIHETKTTNGRPKKKEGRRKYAQGAIRELLEENAYNRVIPVYDGFDPTSGGMTMLTPTEHRFVILYAQTGNATKSAELATRRDPVEGQRKGKTSTYRKRGSDLLARPHVRQAIGMMQKKMCLAAALDSDEVIANIREIAALATVAEKYDAALKANLILGEYLGIFGKTKEERMKTVNGKGTITDEIVDVFTNGESLLNNTNDIKTLTSNLGLPYAETKKT